MQKEKTFLGTVLFAVMLLCVTAALLGGCGPTLRKTLSATTSGAELTAVWTGEACTKLAEKWCKANPCPEFDRCQAAERYIVGGAALLNKAAEEINKLPPEVIDASR